MDCSETSIISDAILLWRLYVVWGRQIKAIVLPVLMCIGSNALVIANVSSSYVNGTYVSLPYIGVIHLVPELLTPFVVLNVITHLALTLLIAGRILYIRHCAKAFLARSVRSMYRTTVIATVESGMIYPLSLLLFAFSNSPVIIQVIYYSLELIMGIANTLIIVQTGLGTRVDDE
ncbi:hypothetical protein WG66_008924 [Moniliophthora roreri]|nr:hypothetical protein WG66_008924 [Moniliophthora roreri]